MLSTDDAPQHEVAPESHASLRLSMIAIMATLLFASLGQTIVSTALPILVEDLGGMDQLTWVITAYLLASTVAAPISGKLGDMYGRRAVLQGGIAVFMLGAVICGFAVNMGMMVAGRAVQGAGAGTLIVTCMATVGDLLPPRDRGRAQGLLGAAFGVSTVIGPLLGGAIVESLSWHWIFFVNLPVGVGAWIVLGRALPRRRDRTPHVVDFAGAGLLTAMLSAVVLLPNTAAVHGWASAPVLGVTGSGLLALILFVRTEARAAEPVLPLSLFRNNAFLVVNGVGFLVGMAMFGTIAFLPLFLQIVKGTTPTVSGLFLVPMMVGLIGTSMLSGRIMARTGRYKAMPVLSTGVLALSMLALAQIDGATPLWWIGTVMVAVGLGLGPVFSVGVAAIQNAMPRGLMGVGTASANMFRLIGGAIGTAAFGAIFAVGLVRVLPPEVAGRLEGGVQSLGTRTLAALPPEAQAQVTAAYAEALHPVFWIAAAAGVVACFMSLMLEERPLAET